MSEDDLERYAMRTLNEAELDRLDDHLLFLMAERHLPSWFENQLPISGP